MPTRREYKGNASATTITADISSGALTANLADAGIAANWPTGPSYAVIAKGTAGEESVLFTRSGTTLTITRAQNDTIAVSHSAGTSIEHVWSKTDADEANAHAADAETDPHSTKLLNNARHDTTARHTPGTVVPSGTTTTTSLPGDASAAGAAVAFSLSDHRHAREPYGTAGNITSSAPGDTVSAGAVDATARIDHRHAREAPGSGGTPITYGSPGTSAVGNPIAAGVSNSVARADHQHGRESFGNAAAMQLFGQPASNGSATTIARSDHHHGSPDLTPLKLATSTQSTTTSTSYAGVSGGPSVTVTVGTRGMLLVIITAGQYTDGGNFIYSSFTLSGANTQAATDLNSVSMFGTNYVRASYATFLLGLNAGSTTIALAHKVSGGTGTVNNREIMAIPL